MVCTELSPLALAADAVLRVADRESLAGLEDRGTHGNAARAILAHISEADRPGSALSCDP
jgi:hypothetical protein